MAIVNYTDEYVTVSSSVVDEAFYNRNTGELVVDLDDEVYRYSNVPVETWEDFKGASSAGNFYATEIKPKYGPAEHLGNFYSDDIEYEEVSPQAEVYSSPAPLRVVPLKPFSEPENLSVTDVPHRKHKVVFDVTAAIRREFEVQAVDVEDALAEISKIADMLNLDFKVKEVTVYFE